MCPQSSPTRRIGGPKLATDWHAPRAIRTCLRDCLGRKRHAHGYPGAGRGRVGTPPASSPRRHSRRECPSPPDPEAAVLASPNACGETRAGRRPNNGVCPPPRHKRASRACSLRASARIEAVVRAGRRCWSQRGDERHRRSNRVAAPIAQEQLQAAVERARLLCEALRARGSSISASSRWTASECASRRAGDSLAAPRRSGSPGQAAPWR